MIIRRSFFGLIGNGETAALISHVGTISWLCCPQFDSLPFFATALDPKSGGGLHVEPDSGQVQGHQRYSPGTATLHTRLSAGAGALTVTDHMPWGGRALVRTLRATGTGTWRTRLQLPSVGSLAADVHWRGAKVYLGRRGAHVVIGYADGRLLTSRLQAGGKIRLVMGYGSTRGAALQSWEEGCRARLEDDHRIWRSWLPPVLESAPAGVRQAVSRSLIVLKLLTSERTGAPIAAPTASFPARPGGAENWDYRFTWLRDGSYSALVFDLAGLHREARRFYEFALSLAAPDGHWAQPVYTIEGALPHETEVDDLSGPGGERPIRLGNRAATQLQLDNEGNILFGMEWHVQKTGDLGWLRQHWAQIARTADWIAGHWQEKEHGIWELRELRAHWLHGRVVMWAGLRAAARMARRLGEGEQARAWRREARLLREETLEHAWNGDAGRLMSSWGWEWAEGTEPRDVSLDGSVLAPLLWEFLPPSEPKARATLDAVLRPHLHGGLNVSGTIQRFAGTAHAFYLCTFGAVIALSLGARRDEAETLWWETLKTSTELGLFAEQYHPMEKTQVGNFPQAFSHQGLALGAWAIWGPAGRMAPVREMAPMKGTVAGRAEVL